MVLLNERVRASLEGCSIVSGRCEPAGVLEAVDPGLAAWLVSGDGPDVVGFAVVVPSDDLDNVELVTLADNGFPASGVEVVVREVDELGGGGC